MGLQKLRAKASNTKAAISTKGTRGRKSKREQILRNAATLIAQHGFDATSMRDIATSVGMLPGSLYYHFSSKEDLLLAIHRRVVSDMVAAIQKEIAHGETAWERLELAATTHLKSLLGGSNLVTIVSPNFAEDREELNKKLRAHRHEYEEIFKKIFDELSLPKDVDRRLLRLQLFGALNWVPIWYNHEGESSPETIAASFVMTIRQGTEAKTDKPEY